MEVVLLKEEGVATLRLNRPQKLNAITPSMWIALAAALIDIEHDKSVRAVVLAAEGRGFCAGADISGGPDGYPSPEGPADVRSELADIHRIILRLHNLEKPVVAAVRGAVVGIGWTLALCCDMIIASETSKFSAIFLDRAIVPEGGTIALLSRQIGNFRAREIVYSCRFVLADEALSLGLVNEKTDDAALENRAREIVLDLAAKPTFAIGLAKSLFHLNATNLEEHLAAERSLAPIAFSSKDRAEMVAAAREGRDAVYSGQ